MKTFIFEFEFLVREQFSCVEASIMQCAVLMWDLWGSSGAVVELLGNTPNTCTYIHGNQMYEMYEMNQIYQKWQPGGYLHIYSWTIAPNQSQWTT